MTSVIAHSAQLTAQLDSNPTWETSLAALGSWVQAGGVPFRLADRDAYSSGSVQATDITESWPHPVIDGACQVSRVILWKFPGHHLPVIPFGVVSSSGFTPLAHPKLSVPTSGQWHCPKCTRLKRAYVLYDPADATVKMAGASCLDEIADGLRNLCEKLRDRRDLGQKLHLRQAKADAHDPIASIELQAAYCLEMLETTLDAVAAGHEAVRLADHYVGAEWLKIKMEQPDGDYAPQLPDPKFRKAAQKMLRSLRRFDETDRIFLSQPSISRNGGKLGIACNTWKALYSKGATPKPSSGTHLGVVGQRQQFTDMLVVAAIPSEGDWGSYYRCFAVDAQGSQVMTTGKHALGKMGDKVTFTAEVKRHDRDRDGHPLTVLSRPAGKKIA